MTLAARSAQVLIRGYQLLIGPFTGGACRFEPSCSTYAMDAIAAHGAVRGAVLAMRRIARCHPLAAPGFDPVPPVGGRDGHQ
jgi:putative membrane protein insertion efficiency factor